MRGTPRYCKLCRGGIVCDGRTEHHLSLQHVEIVVNDVVSTESLISMKVDLGNNYVHEVEIFLNGYVAVIYQGSWHIRKVICYYKLDETVLISFLNKSKLFS